MPSGTTSSDLPERVRIYDADMDIMHPLRAKMIDVALEVLPFHRTLSLKALDLGVGTGVFSKRLLEKFPNSRIVALDGAASMLELAESRLGPLAQRVRWVLSDFRTMSREILEPETFDVVVSSYALHHLDAAEKRSTLKSVVRAIKPGGWFLNADLVLATSPEIERRIQEIRIHTVTDRAPARDARFQDADATKRFLDTLEATEQDQPLTLDSDIQILRESGIEGAEVFWKEYREAVIGGPKAGSR